MSLLTAHDDPPSVGSQVIAGFDVTGPDVLNPGGKASHGTQHSGVPREMPHPTKKFRPKVTLYFKIIDFTVPMR